MDNNVRMTEPVPNTCNKQRDFQSLKVLSLVMLAPPHYEVAVILKVSLLLTFFMNMQGLDL